MKHLVIYDQDGEIFADVADLTKDQASKLRDRYCICMVLPLHKIEKRELVSFEELMSLKDEDEMGDEE